MPTVHWQEREKYRNRKLCNAAHFKSHPDSMSGRPVSQLVPLFGGVDPIEEGYRV